MKLICLFAWDWIDFRFINTCLAIELLMLHTKEQQ